MKRSNWLIIPVVLGVLCLAGCATTGAAGSASAQGNWVATGSGSASSSDKAIVKADTKENFEAVVAAIHKQMQPGGRWQYIKPKERATIDGSFADMTTLYDKFGSVAKMDQAARQRLLADQTTVNAILTERDGDRLVCRSELPVGSHLPVRTCKTYAQIQAEQQNAREFLRQRAATTQNTNAMSGSGH